MSFLRSHGMRLTFVKEVNTNHYVYRASLYCFFPFKIPPPPPQFSPPLLDIFITRLWFGKLWVGKVQGQDVQNSTAHLWREHNRRASSCWKNGMSDGGDAEPTERWGKRRCLRGKKAVNNSQWEVPVPFQNLTFDDSTQFSEMGATLTQPFYLILFSKLLFSHWLGINLGEKTGEYYAKRISSLPSTPPHHLGGLSFLADFLFCRWYIGTIWDGI